MADTADSKSADLTVVRVRLPPRAPESFGFDAALFGCASQHRPHDRGMRRPSTTRWAAMSTIGGMKRLVALAALVAFVVWRGRRLDEHDRQHGYGAYADVKPVSVD